MDDAVWVRLHEIRVRGRLDVADDDATRALIDAGFASRGARGLVATSEGRAAHAAWARVPTDVASLVRVAYDAFLPLNDELLALCHEWQLHTGDPGVLARLGALDERAGPLVRRLGRAVPRLARYRPMLAAARDRALEGGHEWVTSPRLDSYHTVWMLLHEDLLLALGIERTSG